MRLALIRQRYTPYGGAERFIARALRVLKGQGVAVTVFAREWDSEPDGTNGSVASDIVRCDPFHLGSLWRDASFADAVCRAVATRDFDLVQSHERIACCDIYRAGDGVHAQWLANRDRTLGAWGRLAVRLNPRHAWVLAAERRLFASPRLRAVICNSRMVAEEVRRRFAVPEGKLHVIYNGVDLDQFHPRLRDQHRAAMRARLGLGDSDTVYLFVGSGFERKGVPQLIAAFAGLGNPHAQLWIVGGDRRSGAMRQRARALGVGERVLFAGPQREVEPWYGAADCFVLPTLYDPFPNAALEAMASGLPLITSTACGAAELVAEGENGYVCDALDVAALTERMRSIDPAVARSMSERARAGVSELSLETMAARLVALYDRLAHAVERRSG